tara:strand:+ start:735 stop:1511 length:777 start_codon:yes stop_codon:yes gene_type:complete
LLENFEIFNLISFPTYNLLIGIGLVMGFIYSDKFNQPIFKDNIFNVYNTIFISFIVAFLGSRIFDIFFFNKTLSIANVFSGSSAFLGGLIFFVISIFFWSFVFKFRPLILLNSLVEPLLIVHFFGRIGCFLAGCCYGSICHQNFFLGVRFPEGSIPNNFYGGTYPIHPTQLYEAVGLLIIFFLLKRNQNKLHIYLISYGILRFIIEFIRNDDRGEFIFSLISPSQLISLVFVILGISILCLLKNNKLSFTKSLEHTKS